MSWMEAVKKSMSPVEWMLLLFLSVLWGGSFFFAGVVVHVLPKFTIIALRVGLAALALHIALRFKGLSLPMDRKLWTSLFCIGFLNNVIPFTLLIHGQAHIASGLASILNATAPLFTVIVAHFFTDDEKMTAVRFAGVLIGFSGVVLMIGPGAVGGIGKGTWAQIAILGAALSYAFAGAFGRRFKGMNISPMVVATGQVTASSMILIPLAILLERPWTIPFPPAGVWGSVLGLALLSTALAYVIYFRILAAAGANNVLLVTFLIPVSAIILGTTVLGERLEIKHFAGMLLIGLALAFIDGRLLSMLRKKSAPFSESSQGGDAVRCNTECMPAAKK